MTVVAANGDKLFATYSGTAAFPGPGVNIISGTSDAIIVGGTGRFENAEGHFHTTFELVFEGFGDPSWPITQISTGVIRY
jgi:hypothetical protein